MKIDTTHNRKRHIRHEATIDQREVAHTKCGRTVKYFFSAENTSYFFTNGKRYAIPCRICLPEDHRLFQKQG